MDRRTIAAVVTDGEVARRVPRLRGTRTFRRPRLHLLDSYAHVLVSAPAEALGEVSCFVRKANDLHRLKWLLVRDSNGSNLLPQYLAAANLRIVRNLMVHSDPDVPARILKALANRLRHDRLFGRAINQVRTERGLRQEDIGGLSARQVRRIEGGARPRAATLGILARAHGLETSGYLNEVAEAIRQLKAG